MLAPGLPHGPYAPPRPPSAPLSDSLLLTLRQRPHARLFRALFQYLPLRDSPNENPNLELALQPGDLIVVRSEMDDDGFYRGETLDGRSGLVPSNYVERVPDVWLLQNSTRAPSPSFPLNVPLHHSQIQHDFSDGSQQDIGPCSSSTQFIRDVSGGSVPDSVCPYPPADVSRVSVQEIKQPDQPRVPCPRDIVIEKKLSRSVVVAWTPPEESFVAVSQYHVCVDGQVRAVVPGSYKCRALLEDVCLERSVNISIRAVTEQGHSPDAACTIAIGNEASVAPQHLRVWSVSPLSANVRWLPSNSNAEHIISLNAVKVGVCPPAVFQVQLSGLSPSTIYRVSVRTKHPKAVLEQRPVERCLDFKTLPKIGLPEPPTNVCAEVGPQPGTLLVSWSPVVSQPKPPSRAAVQSYLIYADGKNIAQVPTPSADHVLLRLADLSDDPPIFITVRTKTKEGAVSGDSNVARVPRALNQQSHVGPTSVLPVNVLADTNRIDQLNTFNRNLLKLTDQAVDMAQSYPVGAYPGNQFLQGSLTTLPNAMGIAQKPVLPQAPYSAPISLQASVVGPSTGQPALSSLPAIPFQAGGTLNSYAGQPMFQAYGNPATERPFALATAATASMSPSTAQWKSAAIGPYYTFHPRLLRADAAQEDTRPSVLEMENNYLLRHRQSEWASTSAATDVRSRLAAYTGRPFTSVDAGGVLPTRHRLVPPRLARVKSESGFGTRSEPDLRPPPLEDDCRWFVALFDYSHHMSPNANAENEELSFRKHQLIKVFGEVDADGFYRGQIGHRAGLVPSNMVIEIAKDDLLPRRSPPTREAPSGAEPALRRMRWGSLKSRSYDHAGDRRTHAREVPHHYASLDRRDHSLPGRERFRRTNGREYGETSRYEEKHREGREPRDRDRERERRDRDDYRDPYELRDRERERDVRDRDRDMDHGYREHVDREDYREAYRERDRDDRYYDRPPADDRYDERHEREERERRDRERPRYTDNGYRQSSDYGRYTKRERSDDRERERQYSQERQFSGDQPSHSRYEGVNGGGMGIQTSSGNLTQPQLGQGQGLPPQMPSQMGPTHPPPLLHNQSSGALNQQMQQMSLQGLPQQMPQQMAQQIPQQMGAGMQLPLMGQQGAAAPMVESTRMNGMSAKKMVAKFDYDSRQLSPNVDAEQVELSFRQGDIITVYGDMDEDGFFMGELNGQRGLVPSNFLQGSPLTQLAPSQPTEPMRSKGVAFSDVAAKKSLPTRQTSQTGSTGSTAVKPAAKKSTAQQPPGKTLAKKPSDVGKSGAPARKTSTAVKKDTTKKGK